MSPLDDFGPILLTSKGKFLKPGDYRVTIVFRTGDATPGNPLRLLCEVRADAGPPTHTFTLTAEIRPEPHATRVILTLESLTGRYRGVHPGHLRPEVATDLIGYNVPTRYTGPAGLRTNYQYYVNKNGPLRQTVRRGLNAKGKPKWHVQPQDALAAIDQQETWIQKILRTTGTFSDQLTSGGEGWPYVEYTPGNPAAGTIRGARAALREQAVRIKQHVPGPLLSETGSSQFLLGEYVDSCDFGIFEGYRRHFTPEHKLRRLHHLSIMYGMGLGYRYFFAPPYAKTDKQARGNALYAAPWGPGSDDYRAMTLAYGNGAYLDYAPNRICHDKALTEAMTVGLLQRHYLLQTVSEITYETPEGWQSLETILLSGLNPSRFCDRIKITWQNGLVILVNRRTGAPPLPATLPRFGDIGIPPHGWAAYSPGGDIEAFSGIPASLAGDSPENGSLPPSLTDEYPNGTPYYRIDYVNDSTRRIIFINPRLTRYRGLPAATLFEEGRQVYQLPPELRHHPDNLKPPVFSQPPSITKTTET
ncbi:hypothetical protein OPIT5_14485 [Opitutaceae bacterium TAV5]|nr:hypothetical protein OPIT5_14485 [Opitutaceae bacterium TAV5]